MKRLGLTPKRWLLTLHILFASIMFGVTIAFLILSIAAANTDSEDILKACYNAMHVLADSSVRASTIGTVVTGILLSVMTGWGLFKFYWIIVKELLTVVSIGIGIVGMYEWTLKAVTIVTAEGLDVWLNPSFTVNNGQLLAGIILQIISLAAMFAISVFKPWGQRKARTMLG
ncbi:hypothetical protein [Paenibacillus harenae]|uniref:hypothetical protein n=1 Tax=Paenibacillus harenae TaxID=306543 RepID=UPI00040FF72E|nr:hypothetical protein [Paenibacillus harenae]